MRCICLFFFCCCAVWCDFAWAQQTGSYKAIYSGVPWFDDRGKVVSAHGANLVKDGSRFYLFGEAHSDTSNAFVGFNCYSSPDLYNWKFEGLALPVQSAGRLGPSRVGERPKVLKCPTTGEYVMLMHSDTLTYKDQCVAYATANKIVGPYTFQGPLLFNGKPIRKWDMGTFQDADGSGYLITHGGLLYKLSDDYKSIAELVVDNQWHGAEAPTIFKKNGVYFWLASDLTSWEKNDNFYYTATSLKGPWTARGNFAPKGTLTWNSQATFVLPIAGKSDTTYLFMGDRWSYPHQASSATYVWQPLQVSGTTLSIPTYEQTWTINPAMGTNAAFRIKGRVIPHYNKKQITYRGHWQPGANDTMDVSRSDEKGAAFSVHFTGTQVGWYGNAGLNGGYAGVKITDGQGKTVLSAMVDLYSKYPETSLRFISPAMPKAPYTLTVTVLGEHGNWTDKSKTVYGSQGNMVSVSKILVKD
jgi:hypothetical protein